MRLLLTSLAALATLTACGAAGNAQNAARPVASCSPVAARSPRPAGSPPAGFQPGQGFGQGRPLAAGQVVAFSGGVMTVNDRQSGRPVKVDVTPTTQVTTGFGRGAAAGSSSAKVAKGETVTVFGTQAGDGTITASRVLVLPAGANPACGRGPRGGGPAPAQQG